MKEGSILNQNLIAYISTGMSSKVVTIVIHTKKLIFPKIQQLKLTGDRGKKKKDIF